MEKLRRFGPYTEKIYREIAPGHLDIQNPTERVVHPPEEPERENPAAHEEGAVGSESKGMARPSEEAHAKGERNTSAAPPEAVPASTKVRENVREAPTFKDAYRTGAYESAHWAHATGMFAGAFAVLPFALIGGYVWGLWWASGKAYSWLEKFFGGGKKEKKEKKDAKHDHGGGDHKKEDHGHHH